MKVFLTGGAGFIGRSLVKMLADSGYELDVLDNYSFSNEDQLFNHKNVRWHKGDTRDYKLVASLLKGKDGVVHLAAPSSFIMHEEDDLNACNFTMMGFKTVMEAMKAHGPKKIVWASTSAVYERNPFPYHEGMVINPPDSKAGCKHWCELEARRYAERYGFVSIAMRPFSVYGVGEHTKGGYANVSSLLAWAMMAGERPVIWGKGHQTRDFIYVEDAARGFKAALEKVLKTNSPMAEEVNLGFGKEHSFSDVVNIVAKELGITPNPIYVDVPIQIYAERLIADTTKMKNFLGFEPKIPLEEGVKRIIQAARALSPEWQNKLKHSQLYYKKLPGAKEPQGGAGSTTSFA